MKERPNQELQAKLSENFDFSQRTLEDSKAAAEESKAASQQPAQDSTDGAGA